MHWHTQRGRGVRVFAHLRPTQLILSISTEKPLQLWLCKVVPSVFARPPPEEMGLRLLRLLTQRKRCSLRAPGRSTVNTVNKKQCSRQLQCEVPYRPVMLSILPCPPCLLRKGGGLAGGVGSRGRGGGRGHFIQPAIYCTTTWCFTLKGLRTTRALNNQPSGTTACVT